MDTKKATEGKRLAAEKESPSTDQPVQQESESGDASAPLDQFELQRRLFFGK